MKEKILSAAFALAATCVPAFGDGVLVAYFSHTGENYGVGKLTEGNTAVVAKIIAQETGGTLFEIKEKNPYPENYDKCCDIAREDYSNSARPEIIADCPDFDKYTTIFLGYPIWWGDAPMPVYTFLEKHTFAGKTIIPFNTHEGSGAGRSIDSLKKTCKDAKFLDNFVVTGRTAQKKREKTATLVREWLEKIGIKKK